jgi:hypothetical protein
MKFKELIELYGFPVFLDDERQLKEIIEDKKKDSLLLKKGEHIDWWILQFKDGKAYCYNPNNHDWELLEE